MTSSLSGLGSSNSGESESGTQLAILGEQFNAADSFSPLSSTSAGSSSPTHFHSSTTILPILSAAARKNVVLIGASSSTALVGSSTMSHAPSSFSAQTSNSGATTPSTSMQSLSFQRNDFPRGELSPATAALGMQMSANSGAFNFTEAAQGTMLNRSALSSFHTVGNLRCATDEKSLTNEMDMERASQPEQVPVQAQQWREAANSKEEFEEKKSKTGQAAPQAASSSSSFNPLSFQLSTPFVSSGYSAPLGFPLIRSTLSAVPGAAQSPTFSSSSSPSSFGMSARSSSDSGRPSAFSSTLPLFSAAPSTSSSRAPIETVLRLLLDLDRTCQSVQANHRRTRRLRRRLCCFYPPLLRLLLLNDLSAPQLRVLDKTREFLLKCRSLIKQFTKSTWVSKMAQLLPTPACVSAFEKYRLKLADLLKELERHTAEQPLLTEQEFSALSTAGFSELKLRKSSIHPAHGHSSLMGSAISSVGASSVLIANAASTAKHYPNVPKFNDTNPVQPSANPPSSTANAMAVSMEKNSGAADLMNKKRALPSSANNSDIASQPAAQRTKLPSFAAHPASSAAIAAASSSSSSSSTGSSPVSRSPAKKQPQRSLWHGSNANSTISALSASMTTLKLSEMEEAMEDRRDEKDDLLHIEKKLARWTTAPAEASELLRGVRWHLGEQEEKEKEKELEKAVEERRRKLFADAETGDGAALYRLGMMYVDEGKQSMSLHFFKLAAAQGYLAAEGVCALNGIPPYQQNAEQAFQMLTAAANHGVYEACTTLGWCYLNGIATVKNEEEAVKHYRIAADAGVAAAQVDLGVCYAFGVGTAMDSSQAVYWYEKAAQQGSMDGQYNLACAFRTGTGVVAEPVEAMKWYKMAAKGGHHFAEYVLGVMYEEGQATPADEKEAVRWYQRAAEGGYCAAQNNLAACYYTGKGVAKDLKTAHYWLHLAADQNFVDSLHNLGTCYAHGFGVDLNPTIAAHYFRRAAELGHVESMVALGGLCFQHRTLASEQLGAHMYKLAAGKGHVQAQFALACCFEAGDGVDQDYRQAAFWYRQAAGDTGSGHPNSCNNLGVLYETGRGVKASPVIAAHWYFCGAELGCSAAMHNMACCYENGIGVAKDAQRALWWHHRALMAGYEESRVPYFALKKLFDQAAGNTLASVGGMLTMDSSVLEEKTTSTAGQSELT